jgi:hypothetical protein
MTQREVQEAMGIMTTDAEAAAMLESTDSTRHHRAGPD